MKNDILDKTLLAFASLVVLITFCLSPLEASTALSREGEQNYLYFYGNECCDTGSSCCFFIR